MSHLIPFVAVQDSTNQAIANTGTETSVTFNTVAQTWLGASMFVTGGSSFTAPEDGVYQFSTLITWQALTSTWMMTALWINGSVRVAANINPGATFTIRQNCAQSFPMNAGDTCDIRVAQSGGAGNINITTRYARLALLGRWT